MSTANINTLPDNSHYGKIITYRRHAKSIVTGKRKGGLLAQSVRDGREIPAVITEIAKSLPFPVREEGTEGWDGCHVKWYHGGEKSRWLPDIVTPLTQLMCLAAKTEVVLRTIVNGKKVEETKVLNKNDTLVIKDGTKYKILPIAGKRLILTYRKFTEKKENEVVAVKALASSQRVKPEEEPYDLSIFD
jgi:hypothetical protein